MEIRRDRYLERLIAHKGNGRVKIVTGIRRCGKSYLLFQLFKRHLIEAGVKPNHIIEIQLEDRSNKELRAPDACLAFIKKQKKDQKPYYLLIDEVQLMSEFEDVLNSCLHIQDLDTYEQVLIQSYYRRILSPSSGGVAMRCICDRLVSRNSEPHNPTNRLTMCGRNT